MLVIAGAALSCRVLTPPLQANKLASAAVAAEAAAAPVVATEATAAAPAVPRVIVPGTVFRHKLYGYRAVVVAVDASCRASEAWVHSTGTHALPNGTSQAFYTCLVDIRDRPAAQVSYVAHDNVEVLSPAAAAADVDSDRLVLHPLLTRYFAAYKLDAGCYVPLRVAEGPAGSNRSAGPRVSTVAA